MNGYFMAEQNLILSMNNTKIDLSRYHNALSQEHQLIRLLWGGSYLGSIRPPIT